MKKTTIPHLALLATFAFAGFSLTACERDSRAEEVGEEIDEAMEADDLEEAAEEVEEAAEEAAE